MDQLSLAFTKKYFPAHGTISSEDANDLMEELAVDFTAFINMINSYVQPLIDSLPSGSRSITADDRSNDIDPVANGLDGSQIYLDMTATIADGALLYNTAADRPNTIKEAFLYLQSLLTT